MDFDILLACLCKRHKDLNGWNSLLPSVWKRTIGYQRKIYSILMLSIVLKGKYALKIHSMIFFKVEDVIGKIEILLIFGSKIVEFNNYLFRYSWYNFITKHLITIVHLYERAHCMGSNLCVFHVLLHVYDIWKDLFALYPIDWSRL